MLPVIAKCLARTRLAMFLALALNACALGPHKNSTISVNADAAAFGSYADRHILKAMRKNKITGLSAIVFDANQVLWQQDYGYSDSALKIPIDSNTQYQIGSLTKLISAAAILKLQEQNLLSIDDPVNRHLPDFPVANCYGGKAITIKDLLTHESGLANSYWPQFWTQSEWRTTYKQLDCSMVPFRPNTTLHYSNIGFTLLGNIIEQVTGEHYENYVSSAIFKPLQMQNTDFESFDNRHTLLNNLSKSFDEKKKIVAPSYVRDTPAGGVVASATDLVKFAQVFLPNSTQRNSILTEASLMQMLSPQGSPQNMALDAKIGLGWFMKTAPLNTKHYVIEHSGSTIYHHSQIIMYPEQNIGILVMANSGVRFSLGEVTGKLFNRATGIADEQWAKGPDSQPDSILPAACDAKTIPGFYHSEQGLVSVSPTSNGFSSTINGTRLDLKTAPSGYYDPSVKILGLLRLGKSIFGDLQITWRCQHNNIFAAVRNHNQHYTLAYKVSADNQQLPAAWIGNYQATQHEARTGTPQLKIWQEGDNFFAQTSQFPVQYQPVTFLLNRSGADSARLLYLNGNAGPQMVFSTATGEQYLDFMGYRFIKQ